MPSVLELITTVKRIDYTSIVVLTIVGYDYILTFSQEVEYIWNKPWTLVSTFYIPIRYLGVCCAILYGLAGSTFLPSNEKTYVFMLYSVNVTSDALLILSLWTLFPFFVVADLLMILRLWAMYSRSRLIIPLPLIFYAVDIILFLATCIVLSTRNPTSMVVQLFDFSVCAPRFGSMIWTDAVVPIEVTLAILMCILATARFIWQSVQMYKVTKQLRLNRYMNHLVKESVLFFFVVSSCALLCLMYYEGRISPVNFQAILFTRLITTIMFTMLPRFILGLREIHARDVQRRRGSNIYPTIGSSSMFDLDISPSIDLYADTRRDGRLETVEGVMMEEQES